MSEVFMLRGPEAEQILQTVIEEKVSAIMSYLSRDRWHVAKVQLTDLTADRLSVEEFDPKKKPYPRDIQVDQPVGISFKHAYGKFIFDTTVVALEPSSHPTCPSHGGTIVLAAPDRIEVVQRRSYFRVNVPACLKVNVTLWRHHWNGGTGPVLCDPYKRGAKSNEPQNYYQGRLVDISAGGAQVMVPLQNGASQNLRKGQYVGLRFTPMPYEMPLMFNAQIRNILPAEDHKSIYLGLQIVGLEASSEGQQVLSRIAEVAERYYQLNLSGAKQLDMQSGISSPHLGSDTQRASSQL
jgi:hypothetical protein